MHRTHQRRQQRVAYAASVRLHTSGRPHPFEARSINLSQSGVLVESLQPCAVGTEVICEIPLPGGRRQLRGRVARLQALSPAAVGLAIAFTGLEGSDEELLSEAVGQDEGRSRIVHVRFEGMKEPMRSRAQLTPDGLRLSTALPFLRLRSPVEVTFLSGSSRVQSKGLVRQVELDQFAADGTPRLAVSVAFAAEPEIQPGTAVVVVPAPAAPETTPTAPALPVLAATPVHVPAAPPRRPVAITDSGWTRVLAVAAVVALVGLGTLSYFGSETAPPVATQPATPPAPAVAPAIARPATLAAHPAPAPVPVSPPGRVTIVPVAAVVPPPAPPPPALVIPPPLPEGTPGPDIESDGNETTASVPISGSAQGMVHYSLARHKGVAVNLPRAQSELPLGLHTIARDGLRYVWIRDRPEGGIQVRFIFSNPLPDERLLELEDDTVKIRVRLHSAVAGAAAPEAAPAAAPVPDAVTADATP
jgi:hypothetical protein